MSTGSDASRQDAPELFSSAWRFLEGVGVVRIQDEKGERCLSDFPWLLQSWLNTF